MNAWQLAGWFVVVAVLSGSLGAFGMAIISGGKPRRSTELAKARRDDKEELGQMFDGKA